MNAHDQGSDEWWRDFSLEGGLLLRLAWSVGLPHTDAGLVRLGLIFAAVTWAPLALLTALGHLLASGSPIPFVRSLGTHTRLLIAIPLFFVAEMAFNRRVRNAIGGLVEDDIVRTNDRPRLHGALIAATRWRHTWVLEAGLAIPTLFLIWGGFRADIPSDVITWRTTSGGRLTLAGWWYILVSLPIFQFLFWRWWARFLIWCGVLWATARLHLRLIPTHPDLAGGLGVLGIVHVALAPLGFGASAMVASTFAEQILYGGARLQSFALPLTGVVVGTTLVLVAPLFFFAGQLIKAKQQGLVEYGGLASRYVQAFDAKWVRGNPPPDEPVLGSADVQSLADLANSFDVIHSMRLAPIARSQILLILGATALPVAPMVLLVFPLDEIVRGIVKTILNV